MKGMLFILLIALFFLGYPEADFDYIIHYRLPRLIVLFLTGSSLAVSGALMQSLFHNPLASPSVLGISFGGSLLVVIASALNLTELSPLILPTAAFTGAFLTLFLIYFLSKLSDDTSSASLILSGIALSTVFLACQGVLVYFLRDRWQLILTLTDWEAGSTVNLSWQEVHIAAPLTLIGLFIAFRYRRELDVLSLGDDEAYLLGVDVKKVRFRLILASALLTGAALAAVGIIAFFGLIVPHLVRTLKGAANPSILIYNLGLGGGLLYFLDSLLRLLGIYAITVGNLSALLGGLFFLYLLFRKGKVSYA